MLINSLNACVKYTLYYLYTRVGKVTFKKFSHYVKKITHYHYHYSKSNEL